MAKLEKQCTSCAASGTSLDRFELVRLYAKLGIDWRLVNGHHLEKEYQFRNFKDALAFTNRVGELAEAEKHHPDILLAWGRVRLTIWTHRQDGLTNSDFVLAAKVDKLLS